jgi:hypothetical protein
MQGSRQSERDIPIETLRELLRGLRYGTLELTVHDGRVVQIERRERVRLG